MLGILKPRPLSLKLLSLALIVYGGFPNICRGADVPKTADSGIEFFEKKIRPVLLEHCYQCHSADAKKNNKLKGSLLLDTRNDLLKGGDSGPAIIPGKAQESLLFKALQHIDDNKMPPKGKLPAAVIADFEQWIKIGAPDPRIAEETKANKEIDWNKARQFWAFQPPTKSPLPKVQNAAWPKREIDHFVLAELEKKKLQPNPAASKRDLLRRVTFSLTGLPPTPEELADFIKDDSPNAFAKVVDRLLASPHYGERWGRHWLDLVRYADTAGENSDHPLPHAWRYRNWVIDALNQDQPYDEFLREQLAGDILAAQGPPEKFAARTIATGYLALARRFDHDSDKFMHLTHEDGIDTLGKAFLGLTIGCARCHDHKYDAITARDYYALYGILESTKFAFPGCEAKQQPRDMVPLLPPQEWERVVKPYQAKLAKLDAEIQAIQNGQTKRAQALKAASEKAKKLLASGQIPDGGEQKFENLPSEIEVKAGELLQLSVTPLKNYGADTTVVEWEITEVGGKERKWNVTSDVIDDLLAANPHADQHGNKQVWWFLDPRNGPMPMPEAVRDFSGKKGIHIWRNGDTPSIFVNSSKEPVSLWTKLGARTLFVHPAANGNVALGWLSPISGKIRITGRIQDAHPTGPDGVGWIIEQFAADMQTDLLAILGESELRRNLESQKAELVRNAPKQDVAFAVVESKAGDTRLHLRGDPEKLGEVVPRRWLEVLGGDPISNKNASGRLDLANWITSPKNPLTARVMVNRIWLHHFGKGLVKTPNDFGTRGVPPTHPELLDWLASEFVASGWSIKAMHRKILLSATYQQASLPNADAAKIDVNNDLYWRFDRRRLSAEELRDSLLVASGQLDRTPMKAHPFPPESQWSYSQHVPFSTFFETDKRSVYLVSVRNRRHPFLGLFDGTDPNATTPQRQTTTVPTQALYFLNDPFFHAQAEKLAGRVLAKPEAERLEELFRIALQRQPEKKDSDFASGFLARYIGSLTDIPVADRPRIAWSALARIVLASNEFLFVE